jgi:hypothetical protein
VTSPDAGGAGLLCAPEPPVGAFFTRRLSHNRFQLDIFESIQSTVVWFRRSVFRLGV